MKTLALISSNLVLACAFALVSAPASQPSIAQTVQGSIAVSVLREDTGAPIQGAQVRLRAIPPAYVSIGITDAAGRFTFDNLPAGSYTVIVQAAGYPSDGLTASRIIQPGADRHNVTFRLDLGTVISGRIRGPDDKPAANVVVTAMRIAYRNGLRVLANAPAIVVTNDQGEYQLTRLSAGQYYIRATRQPPLPTAGPDPYERYPRIAYYPGVGEAESAVAIAVTPRQDILGVDFDMVPTAAWRLAVTLESPVPCVTPLPGGLLQTSSSVLLVRRDGTLFDEEPLRFQPPPLSQSANGERRFEIGGVAAGNYELISTCGPGTYGGRLSVRVTDRDEENFRIALRENAQVRGRVLAQPSGSTVNWGAVRVELTAKEYLPVSHNPTIGQLDSNTREFSVGNVLEGRYAVLVSGLPAEAYVAEMRYGSADVFDAGVIEVIPGQEQILSIGVRFGAGAIRGSVHRGGESAPLAAVSIVPDGPRRQNPHLYRRITADANGEFAVTGIAPGDYKLFAWAKDPLPTAEQNEEFLATFESGGVTVHVESNGQTPAVLRLNAP